MIVSDPIGVASPPPYGDDGKEWREYWYARSEAREEWCRRMLAMPEDEFFRRMGIHRPPPPVRKRMAVAIRRFCRAFIAQESAHG